MTSVTYNLLTGLPKELLDLIDRYSLRPGLAYPSCQRVKCAGTGFLNLRSSCGDQEGNVYFASDTTIFQYSISGSRVSSWVYCTRRGPTEMVLRLTSKGEFMVLQDKQLWTMTKTTRVKKFPTNQELPPCFGMTIDRQDNILVVTENKGILKITDGNISTFFQSPSLRFRGPCFCCFDSAQNLYIADKRGGRIKKIFADGSRAVTMFAPPRPRPATRTHPSNVELEIYSDLWIDPLGNFFWIADFGTIKMLRSDGQMTSMATEQGASALYVDPAGSIYFADLQSETILFLHNNGLATKNILHCFEVKS